MRLCDVRDRNVACLTRKLQFSTIRVATQEYVPDIRQASMRVGGDWHGILCVAHTHGGENRFQFQFRAVKTSNVTVSIWPFIVVRMAAIRLLCSVRERETQRSVIGRHPVKPLVARVCLPNHHHIRHIKSR